MKKSISIVVACGGGIFTTTVVTEKIKDILRKEKISHKITPNKITEIPNITGADLIVVTGKTKQENKLGIPVMIGLPLFTGVGAKEFTEELLIKIREIMEG
ncbi:PTS sorbitol IIB subunit [Alkalibacter rhizosphaerae]|uniref:PTS sorbitol IIB subunit n=1 Tax=Alkalibacter rhizosphaerae TaxID=2815577 RepID=A0A974XG38_9FIRM|nr:PTS sorbitol IIB subunit [Alkalibacter rhizosphaerae]